MKKPTQKKVKELLKNIELNFSELIDCIIYYEKKDMMDWATDISGYIEKLSKEKEINLLLKDFPNRAKDNFDCYGYQGLWWGIINAKSEIVIDSIVNYIKTSDNGFDLKEMLNNWIGILNYGIETKNNILFILDKSNQQLTDKVNKIS